MKRKLNCLKLICSSEVEVANGRIFSLYRKLREITCYEHRIASFCKVVRKWERPLAAFSSEHDLG